MRFLDAFVEHLDLQSLGFTRANPAHTGRPSYHPGDLLKLYLYGYLNRIRSSRRLEKEAQRNVEVMWLINKLTPDFKTIADFRKDNHTAFKPLFRQFVLLCKELDLFGAELLVVDGSKFAAQNNKDKNFTRAKLERLLKAVDEKIESYLETVDQGDAQEVPMKSPPSRS